MNCINHNTSDTFSSVEHGSYQNKYLNLVSNDVSSSSYAIRIRNLTKSYGNEGPPVIENLCMHVRRGTIYGLLGSSGCGKTTLLSCIVGQRKWDAGEVLVFGHQPGTKASGIPGRRLGYMPQDLALYEQLSIREMIQFFARLYNMTEEEAKERWVFLVKLLRLPMNFKLIANLSGGQKRRASLALALVHSPDLLVLDEPTVGLDPLLRRSIWNHLYKIVSTLNTTIIVTTHYIEESRLAHSIGVMRRGRLLVEDSPANLLLHFQCDLLEDVVLRLCRKDDNTIPPTKDVSNGVTFKSSWKTSSDLLNHDEIAGIFRKTVGFDCDINDNLGQKGVKRRDSFLLRVQTNPVAHSIRKILGFMTTMWLTYLRHPIFIGMIVLVPAINGTLSVFTIGGKLHDMRFGIVNHELPDWRTSCNKMETTNGTCDLANLSCAYLRELQKTDLMDLVDFTSEAEVIQEIHEGKTWGYLTIPQNFSRHAADMLVARNFATNESIEGSRLPFQLDMSQYMGAVLMIRELYTSYANYLKGMARTCGIDEREIDVPLEFREPVYSKNDAVFTEFLLPGVSLSFIFSLMSCITAVQIITDRKLGMLSRAYVAGLGVGEVMVSYMITQGILVLIQIGFWTVILRPFGLEINGSGWLYTGILLFEGVSGAILGLVVGGLCRDEVETLIFGICIFPVLLVYSGVFWPLDGLPRVVQFFGNLLPTALTVTSLRSVMIRGVGICHGFVWPGLVSLGVWMVVFWVISLFTVRRVCRYVNT